MIVPGGAAGLDALDHAAGHRLAAEERALEIDPEHAVEVGLGSDRGSRPPTRIAALLTSTSISPNASTVAATRFSTSAASPTSQATNSATCRAAEFRAASPPRVASTSASTTRAPSSRKRSAMAKPMPARRAGDDGDLVVEQHARTSMRNPATALAKGPQACPSLARLPRPCGGD